MSATRRPVSPPCAAVTLLLVMLATAIPAAAAASSPQSTLQAELTLALAAKRLCSGLFVSGRARDDVLAQSVVTFLDPEAREALQDGALTFEVDGERGIVSARHDDVGARARHLGDQGCVILRRDSDHPLFTPAAVTSDLPPVAETPWPMGDAPSEDPAPARLDQAALQRALDVAFSEPADHTAAFLAVHRGRIVAERYGAGAGPDTQLESWSMGKSVTATLIGILIHAGHLSLEQPAPVPAWQNVPGDPRAKIRIEHLLRMSSGLHCTSDSDSAERLRRSFVPGAPDHSLGYTTAIDVFQLAESRPLEHPPGTVGRYRNCDPLTLGAIVERIVEGRGESYLHWPQQALFDSIGIRRQVLETDVYGNFVMTGFDFGTGRNWARLGLLYLNGGVFQGERILPEDFVAFVSTPAPAWKHGEYGGLFWTGHEALPEGTYSMRGAGGQEVAIVPSHDLVLVRLGHTQGASAGYEKRRNEAYRMIVEAVEAGS